MGKVHSFMAAQINLPKIFFPLPHWPRIEARGEEKRLQCSFFRPPRARFQELLTRRPKKTTLEKFFLLRRGRDRGGDGDDDLHLARAVRHATWDFLEQLGIITRSGPNRPAAAMGGGGFLVLRVLIDIYANQILHTQILHTQRMHHPRSHHQRYLTQIAFNVTSSPLDFQCRLFTL